MNRYIITTESGSDLEQSVIDRYDIRIIPMHVTMGDETYPDGSFPVTDVFDFYDRTGTLPKTAGSTPQDMEDTFRQILEEEPDATIIHIAYSAVTTVSYKSAEIAAQEFEPGRIYLVDSKNVTLGLAMIVEETAKYIEAHPEVTPEEVISFVEELRERVQFIFLPGTLVYLHAGGRVSNLAFHGAKLLKLNPSIKLDNGYLKSDKKFRGSFERALKQVIEDYFSRYDIDPATVRVGGSPGLSEANKELVYKAIAGHSVNPTDWFDTGVVISSHGGPGAFGMCGIERKK